MRVIKAVVCNLEQWNIREPLETGRIFLRPPAADEEGRVYILADRDFYDLVVIAGPARRRACIERQRDHR